MVLSEMDDDDDVLSFVLLTKLAELLGRDDRKL